MLGVIEGVDFYVLHNLVCDVLDAENGKCYRDSFSCIFVVVLRRQSVLKFLSHLGECLPWQFRCLVYVPG